MRNWDRQGRGHTLRYGTGTKLCSGEVTSQVPRCDLVSARCESLEELCASSTPTEGRLLSVLEIDQRYRKLGVSSLVDSNMNRERERETVHEIERER
ncbi:hypothetical protein EDD15DRAFT_2267909 [Pisolithus albus]|nr:hypothetical protein EDD15DRAFT_2267909 [Pisolithus albus]